MNKQNILVEKYLRCVMSLETREDELLLMILPISDTLIQVLDSLTFFA
jgi:hypothetical protein